MKAVFHETDKFTPHFRADWRIKERQERRERYDMTDKVFDNNQVSIAGEVISDFTFSHDVFGEGFYILEVVVSRLSNSYDMIPVMVSERLIDVKQDYKGKFVEILGQFRSYNRHEESKNKLVLSVFAREVKMVDELSENAKPNHIFLDGFVCKPPIYRKTPLGREIADVLLAVNRPYGKSDYIPCICWGRNARFAETFTVGGHVQIWGRIQSRDYQKKISDTEFEKRIAYEVSVSKLEYLEEY
jgi:primosomal replication protein N